MTITLVKVAACLFSAFEHITYRLDSFDTNGYGSEGEDRTPRKFAESNVVTSEIAAGPLVGWHTIALDLDVPAVLVPSSTPGHSHLYIDVPMSWDTYAAILTALANGGVIEHGYAGASIQRKHTALRLPWVRKTSPAPVVSTDVAPF